VITTKVCGLCDCIGEKTRTESYVIMYNKKISALCKINTTFGKTNRRRILLYWILKSLACPCSRKND
jgi:hypothetical protein